VSFDVFLMSFRNGVDGPIDSAAARAVLEQHKYQYHPDSFYLVEFPDGSSLEMCSGGDDPEADDFGGGLIKLHEFNEPICDFIFEMARAGGCVILPAMEPPNVLIPREGLGGAHLPPEVIKGWGQIPVASGVEIFTLVKSGYAAWRAFRDRACRESDQSWAQSGE
jgi:hypothetical protein